MPLSNSMTVKTVGEGGFKYNNKNNRHPKDFHYVKIRKISIKNHQDDNEVEHHNILYHQIMNGLSNPFASWVGSLCLLLNDGLAEGGRYIFASVRSATFNGFLGKRTSSKTRLRMKRASTHAQVITNCIYYIIYTLLSCSFFLSFDSPDGGARVSGQGYPIPFSLSYYYFILFVLVIEQNPTVKNSVGLQT